MNLADDAASIKAVLDTRVKVSADGCHRWLISFFRRADAGSRPQSLREQGYIEAQTIQLEVHWTEGRTERMPARRWSP